MSALFLMLSAAMAQDLDGDGWTISASPPDCAPLDPGVNPAEPEDGVDLVDEDCDGSFSVARPFVSGFESLDDFTFASSSLLSWRPRC